MNNTVDKTVTVEQLKAIETISDVPDDQLQWFLDASTIQEAKAGERVFEAGETMDRTFVILEGRFRICMMQGGKIREVADFGPGTITGYLPFSRGKKTIGYGECTEDMVALVCHMQNMREGIQKHYELTEALVHIMTTRVREFTAIQQQNEKMMALGKLSAGLAHELNNPAAAIVRNTSSLKEQLKQLPELFKEIAAIKMDMREIKPVKQYITEVVQRPEKPSLSMMQRADLEDELMDWLEDHEITDYSMAETLADMGFSIEDLEKLRGMIAVDCIAPILAWINNNLITGKLVDDIQEAARRISELVGSVKTFTHMDRDADKQPIDIHAGIQNTLKMLDYKLKKGNITLKEDFAADLPKIKVMPGEMNQVWTNLIDNAVDAMEISGSGTLRISTRRDGDFVQVLIVDDGPGIPEEIKPRIFDPFFTTKEMGKGTGMGLDVVSRIIRQHNGTIKVKSKPGETEFEVCLPLNN
ncbi:cyclic nucleotide-binding domain-containing protein [Mucilaginibacter limnophilus]|uniref:histidine kinase n=1 Tax=Mucilaginibacter limnophilus TaxID=1932778 RepID=A0A437MYJ7_9SPHI|nr:ATP-binding protein [Mucilaginibacter limnophilus]RVU02727.1 cyclic nucleotide-binding domain-containing protein [Mucilaginibacter limnophilus]